MSQISLKVKANRDGSSPITNKIFPFLFRPSDYIFAITLCDLPIISEILSTDERQESLLR